MINRISKTIVIAVLSVLFFTTLVYAKHRWVKVGDNWRFELHEGAGDYIYEKFRQIDDKVYYFDFYGNMVTGPVLINNDLYIFNSEGAAVTTGFDVNGAHYETAGNGKVLNLPSDFDKSKYPPVYTTFNDMFKNTSNVTLYDDNNNMGPAALAGNQ